MRWHGQTALAQSGLDWDTRGSISRDARHPQRRDLAPLTLPTGLSLVALAMSPAPKRGVAQAQRCSPRDRDEPAVCRCRHEHD